MEWVRHRPFPLPFPPLIVESLEGIALVWPLDFLASKRFSKRGNRRGKGVNQSEAWGFRSTGPTTDSDLRWVPPGSWEARFVLLHQDRIAAHLCTVVIRLDVCDGLSSLILRCSLNIQPQLNGKIWRHCSKLGLAPISADLWPNYPDAITLPAVEASSASAPLLVASMNFEADEDAVFSGVRVGYGAVLLRGLGDAPCKSDESLERRMGEKKSINDQDHEVNCCLNIPNGSYGIDLGLAVGKRKVVDFVARYTIICNTIYSQMSEPAVARLSFLFSETRWQREDMNILSVDIMAADSVSKASFGWFEILSYELMAGVDVAHNLKTRLYVGQARIIILSMFSGFIHAVRRRFDMCLFSVKDCTVLILARHVPAQCVWKLCSLLGSRNDSPIYLQNVCGLLAIFMIIVILELLHSRNLIRNHCHRWIPREAYLAAGWFVKASVNGSYPFIWVHRAQSLSVHFLWLLLVFFSCCFVVPFIASCFLNVLFDATRLLSLG